MTVYCTCGIYVVMLAVFVVVLLLVYVIKSKKRYGKIEDLPKNCAKLLLVGVLTRVCDGEGFYFYHTHSKKSGKHKGFYVRIAGIDAPEVQKYDIPAQPYAKEAKAYLTSLVAKKTVHITILGIDVYNRALANICVKNKNVAVELVKNGLACVYIGKNAVYGDIKQKLLKCEATAKTKMMNMWSNSKNITPMEYKRNNRF